MKAGLAIAAAVAIAIGVLFMMNPQSGPEAAEPAGKEHKAHEAHETCKGVEPDCLPKHEFLDTSGKKWGPKELKGKVVVVNVWATWCKPCKKEIPALAAVHEKWKDKGVVILGLLAEYDATLDSITEFSKETGLTYPVVFLEPEMRESFGNPSSLPSTYIYGPDGKLFKSHVGEYTEDTLVADIKAAQAGK